MSDDGLRGFMRQVNKQGDLDKRDLANKNNDAKRASRVQNIRDQSIRSFLEKLEKTGEMLRISKEVDPATNLSAIEWKTYDQLGKSTIFDNIKGHPGWQACSQILADRKKWSLGLNLTEDEFLKAMLLHH